MSGRPISIQRTWLDKMSVPSRISELNQCAPRSTSARRPVDLGGIDDEALKQVPVLPEGSRLQQGAT
jgi:hypothetical protein